MENLSQVKVGIRDLETKSLEKIKAVLNSDLHSSEKLQMIRQATNQHKLDIILLTANSLRQ